MRGLETLRARAATWPALTRDAGATALALGGVALGQELVLLRLPVEFFLAAPGLLLAFLIFGRGSAAFAALLTAAVVATALDPQARALTGTLPAIPTMGLVLGCAAAATGAAGLVAALVLRARAAARESRTRALITACARDAIDQVEAARARLAWAEAEIVEARRQLAEASRAARGRAQSRDPIEDALRSEGGV